MGTTGHSGRVMELMILSKAKDTNGSSYGSIDQNAFMVCTRTTLTHTVVVMVKIFVMYKAVFLLHI